MGTATAVAYTIDDVPARLALDRLCIWNLTVPCQC